MNLINNLFVEKYKRTCCKGRLKHNPYTCGTFSHEEDPDKTYLDKYLPHWRSNYSNIKVKGFDLNTILQDYIEELNEYNSSKYKYSPKSKPRITHKSPSTKFSGDEREINIPKLNLPISDSSNSFENFNKSRFNDLSLTNKRSVSDSFIGNNNAIDNSLETKSETKSISIINNSEKCEYLYKDLLELIKKRDDELLRKDEEIKRLTLRGEKLSDKVAELTSKVLETQINVVRLQDKVAMAKVIEQGNNSIREFQTKRKDDKLKQAILLNRYNKLKSQISPIN